MVPLVCKDGMIPYLDKSEDMYPIIHTTNMFLVCLPFLLGDGYVIDPFSETKYQLNSVLLLLSLKVLYRF